MATVPTYNRSVQQQSLPGYRVQPVAPEAAFGGGVGQTISAMGKEAYGEAVKQKSIDDTSAVLGASNAMTVDMINYFNGENGIFSRKGDNAKGSLADSEKFFNDTLGKYSSGLTPEQATAFQQHMKPNALNYLQNAGTHERNEAEYSLKMKYANGIDMNNQGITLNYQNTGTMGTFIGRNNQLAEAQGQHEGWSPDIINAEKIKRNSIGLTAAFTSAMKEQDYNSADNILKTYKNVMEPSAYENMKFSLKKIKDQNQEFVTSDNIIKQATLPDGSIDRAKALQLLNDQYGPTVTKTVKGGQLSYDQFKDKIFGQESGGNYTAVNERTGAYGKYQILPSNWTQWSQDAGLSATAQPTPTNQEIVVNAKLQPLYQQYGAQGASAAWYAGEQNGKRWAEGAPDAIGDNGQHYSWDAKQGNGDEPSIREYVESVAGGTEDQTISAFDANKYKAMEGLINAKITDATRIKNEQEQQYKKDVLQQVNTSTSLVAAKAIIENTNLPLDIKNQVMNAAETKFKTLSGNPTQEQKKMAQYEEIGFFNDSALMDEYEKKITDGEDLNATQQMKYNNAAYRLKKYWEFSSGGAYNAQKLQEQGWKNSFESDSNNKSPVPKSGKAIVTQDEYDYLKAKYGEDKVNADYEIGG